MHFSEASKCLDAAKLSFVGSPHLPRVLRLAPLIVSMLQAMLSTPGGAYNQEDYPFFHDFVRKSLFGSSRGVSRPTYGSSSRLRPRVGVPQIIADSHDHRNLNAFLIRNTGNLLRLKLKVCLVNYIRR